MGGIGGLSGTCQLLGCLGDALRTGILGLETSRVASCHKVTERLLFGLGDSQKRVLPTCLTRTC